jgi:uncharacterized damage-inducible protein DinB
MQDAACLAADLRSTRQFFNNSTACLTEKDSGFAPVPGTWTVAQQVAHAARTVDWFVEGTFRPEGFDMDFERHVAEILVVRSLAEARAWLARAFDAAEQAFGSASAESLAQPLPEGPVMGGMPRWSVVSAIGDHTAHHRGALTVYARLLGKVPAMPYMDVPAAVEEPVTA